MTDAMTNKPMRVDAGYPPIPYMRLPVSQLEDVRRILDAHGFLYEVGSQYMSWGGGPYTAYIRFGRGTDAAAVQAALDGVS